jgi:hypothetical protein
MRWTAAVILTLTAVFAATAQVPRVVSYQGVLRDAAGTPVTDGSYSVTFAIYDVSSGGAPLWSETHSLPVADGIINAELGTVTTLDLDFDGDYWLGISVAGEAELTPRVSLTAAPYALRAAVADTVEGLGQVVLPYDGSGSLGYGPLFKVTNESSTGSAVYGANGASSRFGYLGGENHGVYGERTQTYGTTLGYLGGSSYGAYGKLDSGFGQYHSGCLGSANYGVFGEYDTGGAVGATEGGLGGQYGAYGHAENLIGSEKWGYLGGAYGVYGNNGGSGYAASFDGDVTVVGKAKIDDILQLEPRSSFPVSPAEGTLCVVGEAPELHLYVYLNEGWRQLDVGK